MHTGRTNAADRAPPPIRRAQVDGAGSHHELMSMPAERSKVKSKIGKLPNAVCLKVKINKWFTFRVKNEAELAEWIGEKTACAREPVAPVLRLAPLPGRAKMPRKVLRVGSSDTQRAALLAGW